VLVAQPATAGLAKPDLVVLSGGFAHVTADLQEQRWFFRGKAYQLTWSARIKNVGDAPAGASRAGLYFKGKKTWSRLSTLAVPRIPAGETVSVKDSFQKTFDVSTWEYGTYPLKICADVGRVVAEGKEANNCRTLPFSFYVIPRTIFAHVGGTKPAFDDNDPGVTATWESSVLFYRLTSNQRPPLGNKGIINYPLCRNCASDLSFTIQGTDSVGCTYSGSGKDETFPAADRLRLTFGRGVANYSARNLIDGTFTFKVTIVCDNDTYVIDWGSSNCSFWWWNTTEGEPWRFPDPGLDERQGVLLDADPDCDGVSYQWKFSA
jgi:hypothetical protein